MCALSLQGLDLQVLLHPVRAALAPDTRLAVTAERGPGVEPPTVDVHLTGVVPGRDFPLERVFDLRNAEAGVLSVVAKHGHPLFVAVPLDEHLLENGVGAALACRLFAEKTLSMGKAAKLANLSPEAFVAQLGAMGIPAVDYPPEDLDSELDILAS